MKFNLIISDNDNIETETVKFNWQSLFIFE